MEKEFKARLDQLLISSSLLRAVEAFKREKGASRLLGDRVRSLSPIPA